LPFPDERFDTVLCISAHQYFDIAPAFREIARVLKPSGRMIVIGGTLGSYSKLCAGHLLGREGLSGIKNYLVTVANTLGYMTLGRRVLVRRSKWSTAYPVYPGRTTMRRLMTGAGLRLEAQPYRIGTETCFRARRPA
jgi:SAM-dependent methyltransferase